MRQQLCAFVLRHGRHWSGGRWTKRHWAWLDGQRFDRNAHEWAYREYLDAVRATGERVTAVTAQMDEALAGWSLAPVVHSLVALRGVDRITAMTLLAELGDVSRFDSPRQHASDTKTSIYAGSMRLPLAVELQRSRRL